MRAWALGLGFMVGLGGCGGGGPAVPPDGGSVGDAGTSPPDAGHPPRYVQVRLLSFQELQGQLEPEPFADTGGGVHLAAAVRALRAEVPNSVLLTPGDLTGASPLLSRSFHDEPAVALGDLMGLDVAGLGNTDLDRPRAELQRLLGGGCHPESGCIPDPSWPGAGYAVISANLVDAAGGLAFAPWTVVERGGVRVGVIATSPTPLRPSIRAEHAEGLDTSEMLEAISSALPALSAAGPDVIVALLHATGLQLGPDDGCDSPQGPGVDVARALPPEIDVVVVGQGSARFVCRLDGRLVLQSGSGGRAVSVVDLQLEADVGRVVDIRGRNVTVDVRAYPADPDASALVARYARLLDVDREVGRITETIPIQRDAARRNPMGFLVADAYLAASATTTDVAFMNDHGVRASLLWQRSASEAEDGIVRLTELADVLPFSNHLVTLTLTGRQLLEMLAVGYAQDHVAHPSAGFTYDLDLTRIGSPVVPGSVRVSGAALDEAARYRVTVNDFMAGGAAGFTVLLEGEDRIDGPLDLDVMQRYFERAGPLSPPTLERVRVP
jgi:5'-nucleotidase